MTFNYIYQYDSSVKNCKPVSVVVVQSLSCVRLFVTPWTRAHRLPCPSLSPRVCSHCPLSTWCHSTISSSLTPFAPVLDLSQHQGFYQWVGSWRQMVKTLEPQFSISPSNEYSRLISFKIDRLILQSNGLSKIFSSITIWKHWFFRTQPSLCSNSHNYTWLLAKP